jgi:hypothetical protein
MRKLRLPGSIIIVGYSPSGQIRMNLLGHLPSYGDRTASRYNHAMRPKIAVESSRFFLICVLLFVLTFAPACTFYGEHPARTLSEATGGEGLERVFWKNVQAANWVEVERSLASNYAAITPSGALDRSATLEQYRQWQLKDYALGELNTEMNGTTIVVTYTITLNGTLNGAAGNGTAGSQPVPTTPQHMMTVWQQQKKGWVAIAHSVSQ